MIITADTNLILRVLTRDNDEQCRRAQAELDAASAVVVPIEAICEIVWVLASRYKMRKDQISSVLGELAQLPNIRLNTKAFEVGLRMLEQGGDFADGAIASSGSRMGGQTFVSFDTKAVDRLESLGLRARLPVPG